MIAWIKSCYSTPEPPSIDALIAQELDAAQRELLAAQTRLDHATAQVAYQQARISRLLLRL